MAQQEKLVLIDGNALVHRSFHALPPLSQSGEPTNAVYGFTSVLLKVLRELKPAYIVATFDLPAPTFRHDEFAEYKAHRPKTPDDLVSQFPKVKEVVKAFGIPIYEMEGFEADDLIGTIAEKMKSEKQKVKTIIITGDLDTLQLVDDNTEVLTLKKGISDTVMYDEQAVRERFGIAPEQMNDFKGLKGDPSDNIPGVPGVGDKTAAQVLVKYGTLENAYDHLAELPEKVRTKLAEYKDQALFSKMLATIRRDVPLAFDLRNARFGAYDRDAIEALFKKLGFASLVSRLPHRVAGFKNQPSPTTAETQRDSASEEVQPQGSPRLNLVEPQLRRNLTDIRGAVIAFAIGGENVISLADAHGVAATVPFAEAKHIMEDAQVKKIGHDIKSAIHALRREHVVVAGELFDTQVAAYLLSPGERGYLLEKAAHEYLGKRAAAFPLPAQLFALEEALSAKLRAEGLVKLFQEVEMPLIPVLAEMERIGIAVDRARLTELSAQLEKAKEKAQRAVYRYAGEEFNVDSPLQLSKILFEKLDIKNSTGRMKKTKTGTVTTRAQELEKLRDVHPIIGELLLYRELAKLKGTYVDALLALTEKDNRVHTSFSQVGTATGRLASSDPNLQNIPQRSEFARDIRGAFVADEGYSLVTCDFSQIELRIIASLSGDKKMIDIFKSGGDVHRATAAEVQGVKESAVTVPMRSAAKALNFGILYGMGQRSFAAAAGIPVAQAKEFIEKYFQNFSGIAAFLERTKLHAKKYGFVQTLLGRKRWLPDIASQNPMLRSAAERMAQNMPVQGLQADIVKIAMARVARDVIARERPDDIRMLLQIHDELVFEVKDAIVEESARRIAAVMASSFTLAVPIIVVARAGKSLGALRELSL